MYAYVHDMFVFLLSDNRSNYNKFRILNIVHRWHLLAVDSCDTRSKVLINAKWALLFLFLILYLVTTWINNLICFLWLYTYFLFVLNQYPVKLQYELWSLYKWAIFLTSTFAWLVLMAALMVIATIITSNLQSVK